MTRWKLLLGLGTALAVSGWAQPAAAPAKETRDQRMERELHIPAMIEAMGLAEGKRAADVGAGWGDMEPWLSRAVGASGKIYAEDIDKRSLGELHKRVSSKKLRNVEIVQGTAYDPKLPAGLDAVLVVIAYHEFSDPMKMLEKISGALKPGGRLVIVDMMPHKTGSQPRADQTKNHVINSGIVEDEVKQAGFEVVSRDDHFADAPDTEWTRWMIVFRKG